MSDPARSTLSQQRPASPDLSPRARVMLVDDSIVARAILERIISTEPDFAVTAAVPTAADALAALSDARPDIIVLDLEMPGMNGLAALPLLIAKAPRARVIILSANCQDNGPAALEALALGAADTLLKPGRGSFAGAFGQTLVARLRALRDATAPAPVVAMPRPAVEAAPAALPSQAIAAIGVGASTGGIVAINAFLRHIPAQLVSPIFITQHLPAMFVPFFAAQLSRIISRTVVVAADGMRVEANHVYLAPGDGHLQLVRSGRDVHIAISRAAARSGAMPSVDPMMSSLAETYGSSACGIMLSGMGRDGVDGARLIRVSGGIVMAQTLETSVVWGMPGAVVREGLAFRVLGPEALGAAVGTIAGIGPDHE